jgi:hypothetical protein
MLPLAPLRPATFFGRRMPPAHFLKAIHEHR